MAISWHLAKSFLIVLSFGPLIDCQNLTKKNQSSELTSQNRLVEGYSLPGELRDYCEVTGDCREFAYICIRNFCECADGYKADERNKTCVGGVGTKCHYDSHCIENAFCRHQLLCFCKREYWVMSDDYWNCRGEWESKASGSTNNIILIHFVLFGLKIIS